MKMNIDFMQINNICLDASDVKYINLTVWEDIKDSLDISAYEVTLELKKSYPLLLDMQRKGVPCNFYVNEYNGEVVLSQMVQKGLSTIKQESDIKEKTDHIEFRVNYDSIYSICSKFVKNSIEFYDEGMEDYYKMNNLILNSKNTNLNVRIFNKTKGFATRNILDMLKSKDLVIRSWEPYLNIPVKDEWEKREDGRFYNKLNFVQHMDDYYILYINDERADQNLLFYKLSFNYYVMLFGKYFYLNLMKNFVSAWFSFFVISDEDNPPKQNNYVNTKTPSPATITVKSDFTVPTIKKLKEFIEKYSIQKGYDQLDNFLISVNTSYGGYVRDCIRDMIYYYRDNYILNYINMKVLSDEITEDFAMQTIRAACMKKTLLSSATFRSVYGEYNALGMANEYLKSCIFRYIINIKIHQ